MMKRTGAVLMAGLLMIGLLAACGDATATTASTTAASTTSAATTAAVTAATTSTAATTAAGAATTVATSTTAAAATTASAATTTTAASGTTAASSTTAAAGATTSAAGTGSTAAIIPPPGATQVKLEASALQSLLGSIPLPGDITKNAQLQLYSSDDDVDKLSTSYGTALTTAGYKPAIPGTSGVFNKQGDAYAGIISNGDNDLIISMTTITGSFATGANANILPADVVKSIDDQVKGKKTGIIIISGKGLIQALFSAAAAGAASPSAGAGAAATPAGTPTK